ncbi:MAG: DUF2232 domain-containing protein, partial [Rhodospirillaceae bacterium]|nr:DUF2232 domain-containing protein [Rhodospirillaceae bacterium]
MPVLQYNLIAIAAGLLAGLLQGALTLPSGGGLLLAYIAPLPLFLAGLGLGLRGGLIAAAVSGVLSLLFAGLPYAGTQAMVYSLPVIILCRQALLSRNDNAGQAHWYPPGHLLLWLSGMAIAGLVAVLAITTIFDDGLMAYLDSIMAPIAAQLPMPEQQEMLMGMVEYVPGVFAISWTLGLIFNGILAQGLLVRFGYNVAPSPNLADIRLPAVWIGVLLGALFLSSAAGLIGVLGKTLAAIAIVPYFLLGLGVVHAYFRAWKARSAALILLIFFYLLMPFFWPLLVLVAGVGLLNALL